MKVEELSMYGKALEKPKEVLRKQTKVVFNLLRKEFGLLGFIKIILGVKRHTKRIYNDYPEAIEKARSAGEAMAKEFSTIGALFCAIADKRGRIWAKEFITGMTQKIAPVSLSGMYQLSELVKCDGDVFNNFKEFNHAALIEMNRTGAWENNIINKTDDLLEFKVSSCANVELFEAIGCPELNTIGCDHDLAGYPLIGEAVQCELIRPCTLAKGGEYCHFHFYRKGKAPNTAHLNQ